MLFQHLDRLAPGDLLLMNHVYPCRWLPAALSQRGVGFCMRVERAGNAGFACVREFLRIGSTDAVVTLMHPTDATSPTTSDRQPRNRRVWFAMSLRPARCAC